MVNAWQVTSTGVAYSQVKSPLGWFEYRYQTHEQSSHRTPGWQQTTCRIETSLR